MYVEQTLKGEKTSMIAFLFCRGAAFQIRTENIYFYLFGFFRFSIKRLRFNLKKHSGARLLEEDNLDCGSGNTERKDSLRIEICSEKMNTLLAQRQICAADIHCLDTKSKQCLQALCLNTCLYKSRHSNPDSQRLDDLNVAENRKNMIENLDKTVVIDPLRNAHGINSNVGWAKVLSCPSLSH